MKNSKKNVVIRAVSEASLQENILKVAAASHVLGTNGDEQLAAAKALKKGTYARVVWCSVPKISAKGDAILADQKIYRLIKVSSGICGLGLTYGHIKGCHAGGHLAYGEWKELNYTIENKDKLLVRLAFSRSPKHHTTVFWVAEMMSGQWKVVDPADMIALGIAPSTFAPRKNDDPDPVFNVKLENLLYVFPHNNAKRHRRHSK